MCPTRMSSYRFGPFRLEPAEHLLWRDCEPISLPPRVLDTLLVLLENSGHVLTKKELIEAIWPDVFVEENNLAVNIAALRKAFGKHHYIETVPRVGYRFVAEVEKLTDQREDRESIGSESAPFVSLREEEPGTNRNRRREITRLLPSKLLLTLGIVALAIVSLFFWRGPAANLDASSSNSVRFHIRPPGVAYEFEDTVALSPDDKYLAFTGMRDGTRLLWIRPLDSFSAYTVPGTEGAFAPFWSPDGQLLAFFADGQLKTLDVDDGMIRILARVDGWGGSWSTKGEILITLPSFYEPGFRFVSATGGEPRILKLDQTLSSGKRRSAAGVPWLFSPRFLPDGDHFLFTDGRDLSIWLGDLSSKKARLLLNDATNAVPVRPNLLVFSRDSRLFVQPFDMTAYYLSGSAVKIADGVRPADWTLSYFDSTGESLAFLVETSPRDRLVWLDREGQEVSAVGEPDHYIQVALSPDDRTVAATIREGDMWGADIYLIHLESAVKSRLTTSEAFEADPVWSPDSNRIAYSTVPSRTVRMMRIGEARDEHFFKVVGPDRATLVDDWSRDGETLLIRGGPGRVFQVAEGDRSSELWMDTDANVDQCSFSPDGNWIAYNSNESGSWEVYVASRPQFGRRQQISKNGGVQPKWRRDGRELFYLSPDGNMMAVQVFYSDGHLRFGPPKSLFQSQIRVRPIMDQYAVTQDGSRFLVIRSLVPDEPIALIRNWRSDRDFLVE